MIADTFFPILDEHTYTAAEHVVGLVDDPDADAEIAADVRARLLPTAQSALSTRADQAARQGLWRYAYTTLVEKNEEADDVLGGGVGVLVDDRKEGVGAHLGILCWTER